MNKDIKPLDTRKTVTVTTKNGLVTAERLATLSLKARKLLYVIIAQSTREHTGFYTYTTTDVELSKILGVNLQDLYRDMTGVVDQLMAVSIRLEDDKKIRWRHLVDSGTEYDKEAHTLTIALHEDMRDLILGVEKGGHFAKPLLWDFLRMRSKYGLALWHYISAEMKAGGQGISVARQYDIDIDIDTLRKISGTENKLKQIVNLRERVLDVAIADIERNCLAKVEYTPLKHGRKVTGFRLRVSNHLGYADPESMTLRTRQRARKAELVRLKSTRALTQKEDDELQALILELDQMTMEDYTRGGV